MVEDFDKVLEELIRLNEGQAQGDWVITEGFHALTSLKFKGKDKKPTFNPSSGIPVKIFINKKTGELKTYYANQFQKEDE